MIHTAVFLVSILFVFCAGSSDGYARDSKTKPPEVPPPIASAAHVPDGFRVEVLMSQLDYPSSIETDDRGNLFVAESGYAYGDDNVVPRILRVSPSGEVAVAATRGLNGPINDLLWHRGRLYISHRGKISFLDETGSIRDVVSGLPSDGDHHNNQMAIGPDGKLYFGQGTVTNSGVVGPDNAHMGWLRKHPDLHDVPARTIRVRPQTFESENPLRKSESKAQTMAFHAFNSGAARSVTVEGQTKASGTILRVNLAGGDLEVFAWGLRNPYGLAWTPDGTLYATENGLDVRGSRPIANDEEDLYAIKEGAWYGWPDYASGIPVTDPRFAPKDGPKPQFLMQDHPPVEKPLLTFPKHSAVTKVAVSPGGRFGPKGRLFIAFFGHMSPLTGETEQHGGHRVAVVDPRGKTVEDFLTNKHGHTVAQAQPGAHQPTGRSSHQKSTHGSATARMGHHGQEDSGAGHGGSDESVTPGPRRLVDVHFSPDGDALYVVDFGTMVIREGKPLPVRGTGVVWRVVPEDLQSPAPHPGLQARDVP